MTSKSSKKTGGRKVKRPAGLKNLSARSLKAKKAASVKGGVIAIIRDTLPTLPAVQLPSGALKRQG